MSHRLVVASRNRKKRDELLDLLALPGLELVTLDAYPEAPEIIEDGGSFLANATLKAVGIARATGEWSIGDDSGLVVPALGGDPGVDSAIYAGEPRDDERNNDKLLSAMTGLMGEERAAYYIAVLVVADPTGAVRATAEGRCPGHIGEARRGLGGFGYDPLFVVPGTGQTFGELAREYKQSVSHRAAACRELRPQLATLLFDTE